MYKQDLALNNLLWMIWYKKKRSEPYWNVVMYKARSMGHSVRFEPINNGLFAKLINYYTIQGASCLHSWL